MPDLRALLLGAGAWAGALTALVLPGRVAVLVMVVIVLSSLGLVLGRVIHPGWMGPLIAMVAVAAVGGLQHVAVSTSPVTDLAALGAVAEVRLEVSSDVRVVPGQFGDVQIVHARITRVMGRGQSWRVSSPVIVMADEQWQAPALGTTIDTAARLSTADDDVAALVRPIGSPSVVQSPGLWWRGAAAVRHSVRASVAGRDVNARELVPALVDGDDGGLKPEIADDFRTTGLTHLLAVSGTNLTLMVGFLIIVGRWVGVRGRWIYALAGFGIVGFVVLARTEPSVVRAAAMGTVALVGMGRNGRSRGSRGLGVAVLGLLLVDPRLGLSAGFALSVLATAGILLLAPPWRDALMQWAPRWVAEAISVPLAAQIACTPVVAAISGQVSLVAVVANLLAAPAVGPATVLGLTGGLLALVWSPLGAAVAAPAAWSASWIIFVARHAADLPTAAVGWGTGPVALALLTALCGALAVLTPRLLRQSTTAMACTGLLMAAVLVRVPTPGWPPQGWVLAMCDVGQGDALAIRAGEHSAVVVDAGPDPELMDACLDRLDVTSIPLVVLTHFHADHIDGLAGVVAGREVGEVDGSSLLEPLQGVREVTSVLGSAPSVSSYGVTRTVGEVTLQTLWPPSSGTVGDASESAPNNASVVLLAEVQGVRILLTGDIEPSAQAAVSRSLAGLQIDVLKVPHHGSRHQDLPWLTSLGSRLALVSVGEDNDYGHPAPDVLATLVAAGADVRRTDLSGDVVVVVRGGEVGVVARG